MRTIALAATLLLLAGCSTGPADAPATPSPTGTTTSGTPSPTGSATQPSPGPVELTVPEVSGEIARSVFGAAQEDVVSGDAVEGATLEARAACVDPGGGTAWFEVLDARVDADGDASGADATGSLDSIMSGEFACDGTEVFFSTTAPFSGPLQITFRQVPDTATEGYAILSTVQ